MTRNAHTFNTRVNSKVAQCRHHHRNYYYNGLVCCPGQPVCKPARER